MDHDSNNCISPSELKQFLREINFKSLYLDKDKAVFDILKEFDLDTDQKISKEEFVNGFSKWLNGTKLALEERSYSGRSLYDLRQVLNVIMMSLLLLLLLFLFWQTYSNVLSNLLQPFQYATDFVMHVSICRYSILGFKRKEKNLK